MWKFQNKLPWQKQNFHCVGEKMSRKKRVAFGLKTMMKNLNKYLDDEKNINQVRALYNNLAVVMWEVQNEINKRESKYYGEDYIKPKNIWE